MSGSIDVNAVLLNVENLAVANQKCQNLEKKLQIVEENRVDLTAQLGLFRDRLETLENSTMSARIGAFGCMICNVGRAASRKISAVRHSVARKAQAISNAGRATFRKIRAAGHSVARKAQAIRTQANDTNVRFRTTIQTSIRTVGNSLIQLAGDDIAAPATNPFANRNVNPNAIRNGNPFAIRNE